MLNPASLLTDRLIPVAATTATGRLCPCAAPVAPAATGGVQQQHQSIMPRSQPALQTMINSSRIGAGGGKFRPVAHGPGAMSSGTRCHFCKEMLTGEQFIRTDIMVCHIECFKCSVCCAVMLGMRAFRLGNRVCCQACFRILTVCAYCRGPVLNGKSWVEHNNQAFHPNHFFCSEPKCGVVLCFETGFALSSSKLPVCPAHHPDAVSCAACGCLVAGEGIQLSDRIQLTLRHPECFMCSLCGFLLSWEYIIDQHGRPLCCEHVDMSESFVHLGEPVSKKNERKQVTVGNSEANRTKEIKALTKLLAKRQSRIRMEEANKRRLLRKSKSHSDIVKDWRGRNRRLSHRRRSRQSSRRSSRQRKKSTQHRRRSALSEPKSALSEGKSALSEPKSILSERKSTLPERKSTLPERRSALSKRISASAPERTSALSVRKSAFSDRKSALPFWSVGQPMRKSALPYRKTDLKNQRMDNLPVSNFDFSGNKFDVKMEDIPRKEYDSKADFKRMPKGPEKLGLKHFVPNKQPPPSAQMSKKPAKIATPRGMPRARSNTLAFHKNRLDDNVNASASTCGGTTQSTQSDASESMGDAIESRGDLTTDASESTGDAYESNDDASESIDDDSESIDEASELSIDDATESTESKEGGESKFIHDASNSSVPGKLSAQSNDRIEYCRASSDDLKDVEAGWQLRHRNVARQQRGHGFQVLQFGEGSFATGNADPSFFAKRHHPANMNVSYASFFETSSESQG